MRNGASPVGWTQTYRSEILPALLQCDMAHHKARWGKTAPDEAQGGSQVTSPLFHPVEPSNPPRSCGEGVPGHSLQLDPMSFPLCHLVCAAAGGTVQGCWARQGAQCGLPGPW